MDLPNVNLGAVLVIGTFLVGIAGFLSKSIVEANAELRIKQAELQGDAKAATARIKVLEDLSTSRAAVDELGGYVGSMRRDFSEEHGEQLKVLKEISATLRDMQRGSNGSAPAPIAPPIT